MRISDWSSDVCSSDLFAVRCGHFGDAVGHYCNALATHRSESASHVEQANVRCAQHHGRVRVYRGGDAETPGHIRYGGEAHVDAQLRSYGIDRIGKSGADRSEERRVGTSVSVRVDLGGRRIIKKKKGA